MSDQRSDFCPFGVGAPDSEASGSEVIDVTRPNAAPHRQSLRRSWYSLTFSDDEAELAGTAEHAERVEFPRPAAPAENCRASEDDIDSDASTDVGEEELAELSEEEIEDINTEDRPLVDNAPTPARPSLPKLSRQQRIDQLRRVVDEFCSLDFDSVDASAQGGLALRMLVILKSLDESATFYEEQGRLEEKRFLLLDLNEDDEAAIKDIVGRAEIHCEARQFRAAFDLLREVVPRLRGEKKELSTDEEEAMKLRRLQKRLRQRQERREHRAAESAERSARRYKGARRQRAPAC